MRVCRAKHGAANSLELKWTTSLVIHLHRGLHRRWNAVEEADYRRRIDQHILGSCHECHLEGNYLEFFTVRLTDDSSGHSIGRREKSEGREYCELFPQHLLLITSDGDVKTGILKLQ